MEITVRMINRKTKVDRGLDSKFVSILIDENGEAWYCYLLKNTWGKDSSEKEYFEQVKNAFITGERSCFKKA